MPSRLERRNGSHCLEFPLPIAARNPNQRERMLDALFQIKPPVTSCNHLFAIIYITIAANSRDAMNNFLRNHPQGISSEPFEKSAQPENRQYIVDSTHIYFDS